MKKIVNYISILSLLYLAGCATGINEDVIRLQTLPGFEKIKGLRTAAVIPFRAHHVPKSKRVIMGVPSKVTEDNGVVMSETFTAVLKKRAKFKVMNPARVAEFFKKKKEKVYGILEPREVQKAGRLLKVDALIMGEVEDFSIYKYRQHENSRVAVRIRMAETTTGELIWEGNFKLDQAGKPHEVAKRGCQLLLDQLLSKRAALSQLEKESLFKLR